MSINKVHRESDDTFNFDVYQRVAGQFATYPGRDTSFGLWYCITKLNGEAGEAAEKLGKAFRDDGLIEFVERDPLTGYQSIAINSLTGEKFDALVKELGDILWYVARAAGELGLPLSVIANENLMKLSDRAERGKLQGSGDNR